MFTVAAAFLKGGEFPSLLGGEVFRRWIPVDIVALRSTAMGATTRSNEDIRPVTASALSSPSARRLRPFGRKAEIRGLVRGLGQRQARAKSFGFTHDHKEWKVVVNIGGRWAKLLSRDELTEAIGKQ